MSVIKKIERIKFILRYRFLFPAFSLMTTTPTLGTIDSSSVQELWVLTLAYNRSSSKEEHLIEWVCKLVRIPKVEDSFDAFDMSLQAIKRDEIQICSSLKEPDSPDGTFIINTIDKDDFDLLLTTTQCKSTQHEEQQRSRLLQVLELNTYEGWITILKKWDRIDEFKGIKKSKTAIFTDEERKQALQSIKYYIKQQQAIIDRGESKESYFTYFPLLFVIVIPGGFSILYFVGHSSTCKVEEQEDENDSSSHAMGK